MAAKRKTLSRSVRFEVFKRDKFTCQYCGRKSPDVVLEADHIQPVAKGGLNDLLNLVTACDTCNGGKGARELTDDAVVKTRRASTEAMQARMEQLEMLLEWHKSLVDLDAVAVHGVADMYASLVPGSALNENGLAMVRGLIATHTLDATISALREAGGKHVRIVGGKATQESIEMVIGVWKRSLQYAKFRQKDPVGAETLYIRGIVRNTLERMHRYYDDKTALAVLRDAVSKRVGFEELRRISREASSMSAWCRDVDDAIHRSMGGDSP